MLNGLIEKLQGPFGLQNEEANAIVTSGEPTFTELQTHLNYLLSNVGETDNSKESVNVRVRQLLKEMLKLFQGQDTQESRQALQKLCGSLNRIAPEENCWQGMIDMAQTAIANPKHSYLTLAPVIITELKEAGDRLELDRGMEIAPGDELERLAGAKLPQILITLEPKSVAGTLLQMFDRQQVSQLVQLLQTSR
jgi:hypothetical protein